MPRRTVGRSRVAFVLLASLVLVVSVVRASPEEALGARFEALRKENTGLTYDALAARLGLKEERATRLSFDPTRVKYFGAVRKAIGLTRDEEELYRKTGVVAVDNDQRTTMAGAYLWIYRNDLPVLVTVDSILNALHRSFDAILVDIEVIQIAPALEKILAATHERLKAEAPRLPAGARASPKDVDLFLCVARNLLAAPAPDRSETVRLLGAATAPNCDNPINFATAECKAATAARLARPLATPSVFGQDAAVRDVLTRVARGALERVSLYGGQRDVDWSQFKPRGHYANSPELRRYFEAMMWLGRADLGFHLSAPLPGARAAVDLPRERMDAVVLAQLLRDAGQVDAQKGVDRLFTYLVGPSDNTTPTQIAAALAREGVTGLAPLAARARVDRVIALVPATPPQILSESQWGAKGDAPLPSYFQFFGQRFALDSFVLSKVVFGEIAAGPGAKEIRKMPSGLDVMAALGDDEAVRQLRPELVRYGYAANLFAARTLVGEQARPAWDATAYGVWLDTLGTLARGPGKGAVPEVMRSPAWRRKELQTALSSWAELRHDTILYVKQSYGSRIICEYPAGYVEPYPEVFARLAFFVEELGRRLEKESAWTPVMKKFLETFASHARQLQRLAEKELASQPFSAEEQQFLKDTIHLKTENHGCGGPTRTFTGWYPSLIYRGAPDAWEPTVADVHTDLDSGVLEEGVGDVDLLVVAVDNGRDRAAYVGPTSSYYELTSAERLTDDAWRERIKTGKLPPRPAWVAAFQPGAKARAMEMPPEVRAPTPELSLSDFFSGMKAVVPGVERCVAEHHLEGSLEVLVGIGLSGRVKRVSITSGPSVGTPGGACVMKAVSQARFPPALQETTLPYSISSVGQ
jgi:hypothetical protein